MSTSGSGNLVPNQPVVNLGNLYVNGAALTYLTATTMTVGAGQVRDSSDTVDLIVGASQYSNTVAESGTAATSAAVTINTALTGAGGVDAGGGTLITASTLYAVYVIGDSRGFNSATAMLSKQFPYSTIAYPSMPLGYDCYRYVGAVYMDSSKHIQAFQQTGAGSLRSMWYDSGTLDGTHVGLAIPSSATVASQTLATIGTLVTIVPARAIEVMVYAGLIANAAADSLWLTPYGFTAAVTGFTAVATSTQKMLLRVPCGFNSTVLQISYATSSATATVSFTCPGYVDQL